MVGKYKVITLCGSTKFKKEYMEVQKRLTLEGNIVISVGLFGHSGDTEVWADETKTMLDDMHKRKIDMADEIFVVNVGGYIGDSTKSEIEYAEQHGKKIKYLECDIGTEYPIESYELKCKNCAWFMFDKNKCNLLNAFCCTETESCQFFKSKYAKY